jgi:putative PIN family toxin of toxin-antitoxin system
VRVAFDTNVLVSAVATRGLCADVFNLVLAEHELIVGETVIAELKRVLRQKMRVPREIIEEFEALLRQEGTVVGKTKALPVAIRDKSDVPVLSEAVAGNAEVLVTGDRDLLEIAGALPLQVLTPRGLWEQLRKDEPPHQ